MSTYATEALADEVLDFDVNPPCSTDPVPKGRWDVMVTKILNAVAQSGNPYKQILFTVIPGEHTTNHPGWEQWQEAELLCKQPWALAMVAEAAGYTTTGPDGKKRVTATVGQLLEYPLVIDIYYKPAPNDATKQWLQVDKVYHPDDAPRDDLGAYADTPMGVENEGALFTPDPPVAPVPAPAGRPPAAAPGGKLSRFGSN